MTLFGSLFSHRHQHLLAGRCGHRVLRVAPVATSDAEVRKLSSDIAQAIGDRVARIEVDLTAVVANDTKLVAALIQAARAARRHRLQLVVLPSAEVSRWLSVCRVDGMFARPAAA